jgi:hypothetical protein
VELDSQHSFFALFPVLGVFLETTVRVKEVPEADRAVMTARDEGEAGWLDGKGCHGIKVSWHRVRALAYGRSLSSVLKNTRRGDSPVERSNILIYLSSCAVTRMGIVGCEMILLICAAGVPSAGQRLSTFSANLLVPLTRVNIGTQPCCLLSTLDIKQLHHRITICNSNKLQICPDALNSRRPDGHLNRIPADAVVPPAQLQSSRDGGNIPYLGYTVCPAGDE